MGRRIRSFEPIAQHTQTVVIVDQHRVRFTFRGRTSAWYVDIFTLDDTPILTGRRLSPQFSANLGLVIESLPDIVFFTRGGFDPYSREAFEDNLQLIFFTVDELVATDAAANPDTGDRDVIIVINP